ncbi:MAG: zinc ribbon domain-containing protein, partial [Chitinophagaceae bacterium]
ERLHRPERPKIKLSDDMPLRGVIKCHCGLWLSGSPAIKKSGKLYHYYKCINSSHNHVSSIKMHAQLHDAFSYMSVPQRIINTMRERSDQVLEQQMKENSKAAMKCRRELQMAEEQLHSVEEKFITNQVSSETYQRWHSDLTVKRLQLKSEIDKFSRGAEQDAF